jgi:hypothetical protein
MTALLAGDTIGLTRMQAAAIHSAIESRLQCTDALPELDRLAEQGRELLVIANVLECVEERRFPLDEDARSLLATLEMEAQNDAKGETEEDTLVMFRALATYLKVTREMADDRAGGGA